MSERRVGPSDQPVYSEDDLAGFRERWEAAQKDKQVTNELARIQGQISGFAETIRTTARQVVLEVLAEQKRTATESRRVDLRIIAAWVAAVVILLVPLEDVIISHLATGRP